MNFHFGILVFTVLFASCAPNSKKEDVKQSSLPIVGTWELISATTTQKDSTFSTFNPKIKMIKIINSTHFAFFSHDLNMGKDTATAAFTGGGGTYTLKDSLYTENLEYLNYREWEGHTFPFVVTIKNDTLTQQGRRKSRVTGY